MKAKLVLLQFTVVFLFSQQVFSQVGINTESPNATLDVVASPSDFTKIDGIMAPRLTRGELTNKGNTLYGAAQQGVLIYITDVSAGNNQSQRVNINAPGYYYFDGQVWQHLANFTGTVVFTSNLGTGQSSQANATLAANSFVTVPITTVTKNIGGGIWNAANYTYEIPSSGTYLIKSSVRLVDNFISGSTITNNSPTRNIFQAVNTSNVDIPEGIWQISPDITTFPHDTTKHKWYRYTMSYVRIGYFNRGDKLRLYIYSDGQDAKISDASLSIVSLSSN